MQVKAWTVQLLMRKQIFKVLHILNKCRINPEEHLMSLAETSPEIEYRDFVVEQLQKLAKVTLQFTLLDPLSITTVTGTSLESRLFQLKVT